MKHWASKYIGRPWAPGGCWLLVKDVIREREAIEMPDVQIGDTDNLAALKLAAQITWRTRVNAEPVADDIVLMRGVDGSRHVGYMIETLHGLRLLHADGHMTAKGPMGSTVAVPLKDAMADGYSQIEVWRA